MTISEIIAHVVLIGFSVFLVTVAVLVTARRLLPGTLRDHRDDDRVLLAYLKIDAWDLTVAEIGTASRLGAGRLSTALFRLESHLLIEGYWQRLGAPSPRKRRYFLTDLGRDRMLDLERARIDELDKSSG